jgi:carbon starvation protein
MTVLILMLVSIIFLGVGGYTYSRYIARRLGEDPSRPTPAYSKADGVDYVATPTPVVFAHHFASIAGAGPIVGPVIAIIYGWVPAVLWVLLGGVLIGAVHDYFATYMATREGGTSVATLVRRMLGTGPFLAMTSLLVILLALVCATFLILSVSALTSMIPFDRIQLPADQTLFSVKTVGGVDQVVIGGIASMSVVCITAVAPLMGWLYIKKKVAVWKCSLLAIAICAVSIAIGFLRPMPLKPLHWQIGLSVYVLVAAGVPVWIFLQSRDFINVHILYVGMAALLVTLVVAGLRGGAGANLDPIPAFNVTEGTASLGWLWPGLFITIACGAVSGFHSLCAGGTTCKQISSERAARQIGYYGMLLESFLAVCVIGVLMIGAVKGGYISDVHPGLLISGAKGNAVLGFAMAVGNAAHKAFNIPIAFGAVAGMVLLEGFLVTTLDTAIRLTRYLIEEIWRTFFGEYDVFAAQVGVKEAAKDWGTGEKTPIGAEGLPIVPPSAGEDAPAPAFPTATSGAFRWVLRLLRQYWFNSALAVGLMLVFAFSGGQKALWEMFATSNQLLAAFVLALGALWLARQRKKVWYVLIPAGAMLATTVGSLVLMFIKYVKPDGNRVLLTADVILIALTLYLVVAGVREVFSMAPAAEAET